jgi:predicted DNA-binding antitoxin AbrB/MazE fold protein
MSTIIKATYTDGVLKLREPLALDEGAEVELILKSPLPDDDPLDAVIGIGESGRTDGADNHDHYIYGTPKRQ